MSSTSTGIEWTDATWNPIRGCSRVSEGCRNCYAEAVAARFSDPGQPYHGLAKRTPSGPRWTGELRFIESALEQPLSWRKPRRVFVNSMSDLFHESVPDEWIDAIFAVMALASRHTFQILTKRADRMRDYFTPDRSERVANVIGFNYPQPADVVARALIGQDGSGRRVEPRWPLSNVWLGVSCEDQAAAVARVPALIATPTAIRFISAEPLIGPVVLHHDWMVGLDWLIIGGESGPRARVCDIAWVRALIAQCRRAGVWCFVKQLGANPDNSDQPDGGLIKAYIRDPKGGNPDEWADDLRVREFPREAA